MQFHEFFFICLKILDLLLVELHSYVHTHATNSEHNGLLKECSMHWPYLMDQYLFNGESYQKKSVSMLLNYVFLQEGRTLTAMALQKGTVYILGQQALSFSHVVVQWNLDLRKFLEVTKIFIKSRFFLISNTRKPLKKHNSAK